jgi:hypothetical protein
MIMKLVEMFHGSHLYGTNGPTSDVDYKGVGLADVKDVLLGRIPKVLEASSPTKADGEKNQPGDVDRQIFSLHAFIAMALKGETVAIDMLHAKPKQCQVWTAEWTYLNQNRDKFYTRSMSSLVGYARAQASKYGLKGSRLAAAKAAQVSLIGFDHMTLGSLPRAFTYVGDHVRWHNASDDHNGLAMYEVCGMKFQETAKTAYVRERLQVFIDKYGERAKMAETNQGVDWKAVMHAFRAGYQMRAILRDGGFEYPLPETSHLLEIRGGDVPYIVAGPQLEDLIDEVERLAESSVLPEKSNQEWADSFVTTITYNALSRTKVK